MNASEEGAIMEQAIQANKIKLAEYKRLNDWVSAYFGQTEMSLLPLTGDASFKAFYRVSHENISYMLMAAPPTQEKVVEFFEINQLLIQRGVNAPIILASDLTQGYFLMQDFGDQLYAQVISDQNMSDLYRKALASLVRLQAGELPNWPKFDKTVIQSELSLFTQWCLPLLGFSFSQKEAVIFSNVVDQLTVIFEEQPQVLVHRDYHSRNLLVIEKHLITPGVIDFQDALIGPITYDVASLLKDCYLTWPKDKLQPLLEDYYLALRLEQKEAIPSFEQFMRWFDLTGLQRHLKVLGIFSRLYLRDNKTRYLYDMPRVLAYVLSVTQDYAELSDFHHLIRQKILPAFGAYWRDQHISIMATVNDKGHYHSLLEAVS